MRRLAVLAALAVFSVLGFGAAFVLAQSNTAKQSDHITICHSGGGKNFTPIAPADVGALEGHVKNDPDDIIPPFAVIQSGTTTFFPGQNMGSLYGAGFTGAEVLANNCDIPTGARPAVTTTVISTTTATVPIVTTVQGTTITVPPETRTKEITVTVTAPAETTTAPGTTTIVTLPSNVTTTVTLPERTVTLPAVTHTIAGETIERDASTVTLAGTTATVTAGATTTVVTVTGPNKVVREGVLGTKHAQVTLTTPKRVVRVGARVIHVLGKGRLEGKKVIVVVVRSNGCPAGTALHNGECRAVVRGQG